MEPILRFIFELILPSSQISILVLLSIVFLLFGIISWAKRSVLLLIVLYLLYATPFLCKYLSERLEQTYPVFKIENYTELENESVNIIVLGAGYVPDPRLSHTHMMNESLSNRLIEAIRIYNMLPSAVLVTSASAIHSQLSQAETSQQSAIQLGVNPEDIYIQDDPTNTCEEAKAFVRDHGVGTTVIIATSAMHMRRAMMLFESQGAKPIPAPTDFRIKKNPDRPAKIKDYFPKYKNIEILEFAIREYIGYWWTKSSCKTI